MAEILNFVQDERAFQVDSSNQVQHRFRTVQFHETIPSVHQTVVDIKKELFLKENGQAAIVFDVLLLSRLSLSVGNLGEHAFSFSTFISPDLSLFRQIGGQKNCRPGMLELIKLDYCMKYVKVVVQGEPMGNVLLFLQGITSVG